MKQISQIHFQGPFKLHEHENCVFDNKACNQNGIYLWVIKEKTGCNYISYIGETGRTFRERLEEHILGMTSLNYRISDSEVRIHGKEKIIWKGHWRVKSIKELINNYEKVSKYVTNHIKTYDIYLSSFESDTRTRRRIEGEIGEVIKKNKKYNKFFPDDNRIGWKTPNIKRNIKITSEEELIGLPKDIYI